jgi:hypothetical protein
MAVADQVDIAIEVFGGLVTQIAPADLPHGVSPDCQDLQFQQGDVATRPGIVSQYQVPGNPTINFLKTYLNLIETPRLLSLDSLGVLRKDATPGGTLQIISSALLPGIFGKSTTAFGREYIALGNGAIGADIPRQYNDTWLDRVSQVGPGASPQAQDESIVLTTLNSPNGLGPEPASPIAASPAGLVEVGNVVTVTLTGGNQLFEGFAVGNKVVIAGAGVAAYDGTWVVSAILSVVGTGSPGQFQFIHTQSGLAASGGGTVDQGVVNAVFAATPPLTVGQSVTISGAGVGGYNGTFPVTAIATDEFFYNVPGAASLANSGSATVTAVGNIVAGVHQLSVIFVTRNGYYTAPAPPSFWTAGGGKRVVVVNIPTGPPNVIARVITFTAAGGASFYHLGPFDATLFSSNMYIPDNITTTATFDFVDGTLQLGTLDDPLFNLIELPEVAGAIDYAERMFYWGERNMLTGFLNLPMDGGFGSIPSVYPLGWVLAAAGSGGGGSAVAQGNPPFFGDAYTITGDGATAIRGKIFQSAYQDYLLNPLLQPNTAYTIRARIEVAGATAGTIHANLQSTLGGFTTAGISQAWNTLTGSYAVYEGNLTSGLATIPTDLQLQVYVDGTANVGAVFSIKILGIYPTNLPFNGSNVRGSGTGDDDNQTPESFDSQTGLITISENNGQSVRSAFKIRERLYLVKEDSFFATQDDGVNEPSGWSVQQVSSRVGTPSVNGVGGGSNQAGGEDWAVIAHRTGLYIFYGGEPSKICPEIQPTWDTINWQYGSTISVAVDTQKRRIYVCAPFGTSTIPNQTLVLDYHDVGGPDMIASMEPVKLSYTGKKIVSDKARKWCPWTIAANCVAQIEEANGTTQVYFGSNDQSGNINELDSTGLIFTDTVGVATLGGDTGVRANENPINPANWTTFLGLAPFQVLSDVIQGTSGALVNGSLFTGVALPPNQFAQVTVDNLANGGEFDLLLRADLALQNFYDLFFVDNGGGTAQFELLVIAAQNTESVTLVPSTIIPFPPGSVISASIVNSQIIVSVNGVTIASVVDPTIASGSVGILSDVTNIGDVQLSNFSVGEQSGGTIPSYYTTAAFPELSSEQPLQLRSHRKLFAYLTLYVQGNGLLGVTVYPSSLSNAIALNPFSLTNPSFEDLEMMTNVLIERMFYKFSSSGLGQWFSLQRACVSLKVDPWAPVRGVN